MGLSFPKFISILYFLTYVSNEPGYCFPNWTGKWFPQPPGKEIDDNPTVEYHYKRNELYDHKHGIQMGIATDDCDDGKTNLRIDWDGSPVNYTCFDRKTLYLPRNDVNPIYSCDFIPTKYSAMHKCMDTAITYNKDIPTFGTHRPLWPKYGEYRFVPRQRWIHNLEHGAVVMLYHPCANNVEVNLLRHLVINCLYRHIITPYTLLSPKRPLALVTWGRRLEMSQVDPNLVIKFIKANANHAPEHTSRDGQFDAELIEHAAVVTDKDDKELCPDFDAIQNME